MTKTDLIKPEAYYIPLYFSKRLVSKNQKDWFVYRQAEVFEIYYSITKQRKASYK